MLMFSSSCLNDMLAGAAPLLLATVEVVEERLACCPSGRPVPVVAVVVPAAVVALVVDAAVPNPPREKPVEGVVTVEVVELVGPKEKPVAAAAGLPRLNPPPLAAAVDEGAAAVAAVVPRPRPNADAVVAMDGAEAGVPKPLIPAGEEVGATEAIGVP